MSLKIIRPGILDTIQDHGRWGHQHQGINPGGVMDLVSASLVNIVLGIEPMLPVLEMHFPAPTILFDQPALICLGGADFSPTINGDEILLYQPVVVSKNSILQFQKWKSGSRCYLAVKEKFDLIPWLNSFSTNLKASCGGFKGRPLQKDDLIKFKEQYNYTSLLGEREQLSLPWRADPNWTSPLKKISLLKGKEWNWLTDSSKNEFLEKKFAISTTADRMGYRLNGKLEAAVHDELVSSAVSFGTIQLLPGGELIILMADHQTTGGYPRIAQVISADLSKLAQQPAGQELEFEFTDLATAENLWLQQQHHLHQLQNACKLKWQEFFHAKN